MKNSWIIRFGIMFLVMGILVMVYAVTRMVTSPRANEGDSVSLNYTLSLDDGEVYYASDREKPKEYQLGEGLLLPAFEAAITGMRAGESRTVTIPFIDAYGPYQPELVMEVDRSELPAGTQPAVGLQLQAASQSGSPIVMVISEVTESTVTLDANHPLAGRDLTFEIELVAVANNRAWIPQVELRWVVLGIVGVAFIIAIISLRRRVMLRLMRATKNMNEQL